MNNYLMLLGGIFFAIAVFIWFYNKTFSALFGIAGIILLAAGFACKKREDMNLEDIEASILP
ncbi:MAG TPA: hypothetical protein VMC07_01795 [Candidatus Omnitrophota bacterium]|nr:hypothetical protein [Candidatus Omnitrophota bacterium]